MMFLQPFPRNDARPALFNDLALPANMAREYFPKPVLTNPTE
jgi:hypothetical protein